MRSSWIKNKKTGINQENKTSKTTKQKIPANHWTFVYSCFHVLSLDSGLCCLLFFCFFRQKKHFLMFSLSKTRFRHWIKYHYVTLHDVMQRYIALRCSSTYIHTYTCTRTHTHSQEGASTTCATSILVTHLFELHCMHTHMHIYTQNMYIQTDTHTWYIHVAKCSCAHAELYSTKNAYTPFTIYTHTHAQGRHIHISRLTLSIQGYSASVWYVCPIYVHLQPHLFNKHVYCITVCIYIYR